MTDVATVRTATLVDADVFDFSRLERVVCELIDERQRLTAENELLRQELLDRERRLVEFASRQGQP